MHTETKNLLAALAERDQIITRETRNARHARTIIRAMDLIHHSGALDEGMGDVLRLCRKDLAADAAIILSRAQGGDMATLATDASEFGLPLWRGAAPVFAIARREGDIEQAQWRGALPDAARHFRSLIAVPLGVQFDQPMALALFSTREAAFTRFDHRLLRQVGRLLEQAIHRMRLVHRNTVLTRLVGVEDGGAAASSNRFDASFSALSSAYARIVEWQGRILEITNELLACHVESTDAAIDRALARTGALADCDRTYVFRLREPDRLDNTHEWTAPGVEPMIDQLQDMPAEPLQEWLPDLEAAQAVQIPDVSQLAEESVVKGILEMQGIRSLVAAPMQGNGRLAGFVGFDSVRRHRRFLPMETQLLQSVANAIGVVLERASAEAAAENARNHLKNERDRLRATLTAIPDLVLELDHAGRFVGYNAGGGLPPAITPELFLGRTPDEVFPGHVAAIASDIMCAIDRDGVAGSREYQLSVDGEPRWFVVTAAQRALRGEAAGYVLVVRDITENYRQQSEIKRLGKIAELTSNLVVVTDAGGRIEWVNPAFERRSGWRLDEIRGKTPGSFLQTARTDPETVRRVGAALSEGRPVQAEIMNISRSGADYWVSKDIQPLVDETGRLDGFVSVQTDITELKLSQQQAIRERALAMEASTDGIAITGSSGRFTFMNSTHRSMFGIGADEDVGRLSWTDLYDAETAARFRKEEWPGLIERGFWRGEMVGRRRDGGPVPQEVSLTLQDDGGLLCITRDISERIRTSDEQTRLREELQLAQRRETIAHVASGVAHDLNNLMAVVVGSTTQLETLCAGEDEALAGLGRIRRAMGAAADLVASLRDLTRPSSARSAHDLGELVADAVELLGAGRKQRHDVSLTVAEDRPRVWATPTEVLQVVVNLLLNACEARFDGRSRVSLAILSPDAAAPSRTPDVGERLAERSYALFTVSDTGDGVDEATRAHLFDRYFTTKGEKGTGLGLPIVATILRDNGGALWFDSAPGEGATVTVAWPSTAKQRRARSASETMATEGEALAGLNIVVVDDVEDVAEVIADMLEERGATTVVLSDPHEALRLIESDPAFWSVLVTDLHMPEMSGAELAHAAARLAPPIPAVLVTALPGQAAADATFAAVLAKPAEPKRLVAAVRDAALRRPTE